MRISRWTSVTVLLFLACFVSPASGQAPVQNPPPLPMGGAGRPQTPGITRTTLLDDEKKTVTRVHFIPGAAEPPHSHALDVVLVPVTDGVVEWKVGDKMITSLAPGDVQIIPKGVTHSLKNAGTKDFEAITIAIK